MTTPDAMIAQTPFTTESVRIVLFDVDNTLMECCPGASVPPGVYHETLVRLLVDTGRAPDEAAARRQVEPYEEAAGSRDVAEYLGDLGVDEDNYLAAVTEQLRPCFQVFPDAMAAVRGLAKRGYELYPATTNSSTACLTKFAAVEMERHVGPVPFVELFGGSQISPLGKNTPDFYTALLQRIGAEPDEVVMVGDHPHADLALARQAGIERVVLPRRDQPQPWVVEPDGGIYVRSLERLLDWLPPRSPTAPAT